MAKVMLDAEFHAWARRTLLSDETERLLLAAAGRVQAAAEADDVQVNTGAERGPMPYETVSAPSHDRARVYVVAAHPAGLAAEVKYGTLVRALDSA